MYNILFDIIWYLAVVFSILAFITNSRKRMLIYWILSTFLFGISIFNYGWYDWLSISLISIIIKLLSLYVKDRYLIYIRLLLLFVAIVLFFFLPEWIEGILPVMSLFFIIMADTQKDVLYMKYWYYGSNLLWLSYGIILFSIPAILFDVLGFMSITYWIYKIKVDRKSLKKLI